jgi:hypothetical protein
MALFESYERRMPQIQPVLARYGMSKIEAADELCKGRGVDVASIVKGVQPICFENACWAYTLGAAIAGTAGALLAQTTGFASLDVLEFHRSADVMLALVIGGAGWLWGGLAGAIAFKVMHDVLSAFTPQYWTFWIGLFLVVLMLVGRERLFRPWTWFGRGGRP